MEKSRLEIFSKVWLDFRRAIYLEEEGLLAVADLHLGYAWAHRYAGQMLPLVSGDCLEERLSDLCGCYRPRVVAVLGDIVHRAVPVAEVKTELLGLLRTLTAVCDTRLVLGNHDRQLRRFRPAGFCCCMATRPPMSRGAVSSLWGTSTPQFHWEMASPVQSFPVFSSGRRLWSCLPSLCGPPGRTFGAIL
jgi:hypothetical protein